MVACTRARAVALATLLLQLAVICTAVEGLARWQNVTVYHVHPSSNLHGDLRDMNSGDQAGDVSAGSGSARVSPLDWLLG